MSQKRLFIGNLAYELTDSELRNDLEAMGIYPDSLHIALDRDTGRGKGFAFIEFKSDQEAQHALNALPGHPIGNRPVRVEYATPRDNAKPRTPGTDTKRPPADNRENVGGGRNSRRQTPEEDVWASDRNQNRKRR